MNERESQEQVHLIPPGTSVASRASEEPERLVAGIAPMELDAPLPSSGHSYGENCTRCAGGYCLAFPNWNKEN